MLCFVGLLFPQRDGPRKVLMRHLHYAGATFYITVASIRFGMLLLSDDSGKLDKKESIHVYWVNREEKVGQKEDINFFSVRWPTATAVEKGEDRVVFT